MTGVFLIWMREGPAVPKAAGPLVILGVWFF